MAKEEMQQWLGDEQAVCETCSVRYQDTGYNWQEEFHVRGGSHPARQRVPRSTFNPNKESYCEM